ncbi:glycosyltransferase family 2 protein [Clostridium sp. D2Q-11]|uniref:Glycosyltransferase family 2 protein n=1 Tax=Anaeromonas frigoriresistens TaxID=2683708 RepID=A0A942Z8Q6_9FIRM|nr:glycosyltransferase family A protein [Anaeromonas frigoriresistens]MBS4540052.1 glycosyltransferase family 2 protein [Anaeromonas frigoriresistens]
METNKVSMDGVSVITITNKGRMLDNIFSNYTTQRYENKELIIVINNNHIGKEMYINKFKNHENIYIYVLDEKISLGKCLNFAVEKSNYNIIAKFDDDDYYGMNYLMNSINTMKKKDTLVIGKSTNYVYFEDAKILALRNVNRENTFVRRVEGPTLIFKKSVFDIVRFVDKSLGEDVQFCKDCIKNKIPIYSSDKEDFVYIRHTFKNDHTWKIDNEYYIKLCKIIGKYEDFKEYINF